VHIQVNGTQLTGLSARLADAARSLSDWMRLAAEVARADDEALAAEFRASEVTGSSVVNESNAANPAAPTRNRGAAGAGAGPL
jgi:hypothetical protein